MNELRMYVEHLFEGKVLTPETIELKEEIYGNLMARYEDYVASGLSDEEALARTKASITDVDDMLAGEGVAAPASDAAPTTVMPAAQQTVKMATPVAIGRDAGAPTPPATPAASGASSVEQKPKSKTPMIAGIAAVVIIALVAVMFGVNEFILDPARERQEDIAEAQAEQQWRDQQAQITGDNSTSADGAGTSAQNGSGGGADSSNTSSNQGTTPQFADPEDQLEYEASTALMDEVRASGAELPRSFAGSDVSDDAKRGELVSRLPLGTYVESTSVANSTLDLTYRAIDHNIDGDALDLALAYDVTALMAVYPSIDTIGVTLNEDDDHERDVERYQFTRQLVNDYLARASNSAITQVNDSLFESDESWEQALNYLSSGRYYDELTDRAEIDS